MNDANSTWDTTPTPEQYTQCDYYIVSHKAMPYCAAK